MPVYLFILGSKMRAINLVDRHHHSHHDGSCEQILGLVLSKVVHKVTEVAVLHNKVHFFS